MSLKNFTISINADKKAFKVVSYVTGQQSIFGLFQNIEKVLLLNCKMIDSKENVFMIFAEQANHI